MYQQAPFSRQPALNLSDALGSAQSAQPGFSPPLAVPFPSPGAELATPAGAGRSRLLGIAHLPTSPAAPRASSSAGSPGLRWPKSGEVRGKGHSAGSSSSRGVTTCTGCCAHCPDPGREQGDRQEGQLLFSLREHPTRERGAEEKQN